ncbi:TolB-like protein/tetratricopeptide (TPR) repeat protein [Lysobacter niabensis]|uniref:TolB-like protein/tetratricopeptide (TPR) repeat protein n=1 Tax=Agrilutibacter niabensis TaxID=380628 RepID=A0ABU1VMC9_9GAMM|nr:winged helix-turn-helix domain-containing protein [Lysobacter niabensis]MDR7098423.1 TolB-like protein/tetratricopeptide (TPR) repeat protein [Lysobacter niabensis]
MNGSQTYDFDRFRLSTVRHELFRDGQPVALEPKAFCVLTELLEHGGELLSHNALLDAVWGHRHVTPGVLNRSIALVRRALGDDSEHPRYVQTVHALGYRFIAPVTRVDDAAMRTGPAASVAIAPVASPPPETKSLAAVPVAVLPFANMSDDPGQAFLSDGLAEDIITELSRWHMLAVRSRAASFRHRGVAVDVQEVARELDVRFIVEGSVRRMGERVRITAQLIDTESCNHIWAEKFDRTLSEIFDVQDEVVGTIVATLVGRVQARDAERARRKPPSSLAAYECVLRGNALPWAEPEGRAEATRLFEQAIALDPDYGFAHALLAAMRYGQWYDDPVGDDAALDEALALAMRGVELDPDESTCHSILAQVCHLRGDFDLCAQHIRRAVELNPSNQWNVADMGMMLNYLGEAGQALAWFERARQIDPYFDPPWYWREYGMALLLTHRYREAAEMFSHVTDRNFLHLAPRAASNALLGDMQAARRDVADCMAEQPDFSIERYFAKLSFKRQADIDHLAEALRQAGFPES